MSKIRSLVLTLIVVALFAAQPAMLGARAYAQGGSQAAALTVDPTRDASPPGKKTDPHREPTDAPAPPPPEPTDPPAPPPPEPTDPPKPPPPPTNTPRPAPTDTPQPPPTNPPPPTNTPVPPPPTNTPEPPEPTNTPVPPPTNTPLPPPPPTETPIPPPPPTNTPIPPPPPTNTPIPPPPPTSTPTPVVLPTFPVPTVPPPPESSSSTGLIQRDGYGVALKCAYHLETDTTNCRFTVNAVTGQPPYDSAVLTSALCTEAMDGTVSYVEPDPQTGAIGYRFDAGHNKLVLVGKATVKGNAHYVVDVSGTSIKLTGPGISCGVSKSAGTMIIVAKYVCSVPAGDARTTAPLVFTQPRNEPFQSPDGAAKCHAVGEGDDSFTLDHVDKVPSIGGLPTHANGRVRFLGVRAGQYRLIEGATGDRSQSFSVPGTGIEIFHVIQFVVETRVGEIPGGIGLLR
jgi:hypothetical protein